jgi:hypothetical protein
MFARALLDRRPGGLWPHFSMPTRLSQASLSEPRPLYPYLAPLPSRYFKASHSTTCLADAQPLDFVVRHPSPGRQSPPVPRPRVRPCKRQQLIIIEPGPALLPGGNASARYPCLRGLRREKGSLCRRRAAWEVVGVEGGEGRGRSAGVLAGRVEELGGLRVKGGE